MSIKLTDELPKNAKNAPNNKRKVNYLMSLKATSDDNGYRFRLLSFFTGTNSRDYPFIEKYVHEKWEKDAEGKGVYKGFVTCPSTPYVRRTLPPKTNPYEVCKVCKYVNANFLAFKESNYTDKIASKAQREHKRKYIALVPVYVVKDPHEPANVGKFRVWCIKDKAIYDELNAKIKKHQASGIKVFNKLGADLQVFLKKEDVFINEGKPNEFKYSETKINKFGFGKQVYEIASINEKAFEDFPFDEEFYTSNTIEEIDKYYDENVLTCSNVPEDKIELDDDIVSNSKPTESASSTIVTDIEVDNIIDDSIIENEPLSTIIDKDLDGIDDLVGEQINSNIATSSKPVKNDNITSKADTTLDDVDSIIDGIL